jgi:16S rRNA (cytosine1402-N4)-methyltransferase
MERGSLPNRLPIRDKDIKRSLSSVGKPVRASVEELGINRRARSAIMRTAEKAS